MSLPMIEPLSLMRVHPNDPAYLANAEAEADFWSNRPGVVESAGEGANPFVRAYVNRRFTGDGSVRWFETLHTHGQFYDGLVLGSGGIEQEAKILELNPGLRLTIMDISEGTLERRERQLAPRFPGRVSTRRADFNFVDLEEAQFDVIVSSSAIHHVTNLEHLASQANQALRAGGLFFLHDYVGESRRRFSAAKKQAYEDVYNRELERQHRPPTTLVWSNGDEQSSPFCGVRSGEILDVFRAHLNEKSVRTAAGLWFPVFLSRDVRPAPPIPVRWRIANLRGLRKIGRLLLGPRAAATAFFSDAFLEDLLETSDRLTEAGEILPSNAFAIYAKR